MKAENLFYLGFGAVIGWYLCTNKRKQTERALSIAKKEVMQLGNDLEALVSENDRLSSLAVTEDVQNNRELGL